MSYYEGSRNRFSQKKALGTASFQQNHGRAGVVYILTNPGLASGLYKIGCSTRSGGARAADLNRDANTGTPGEFKCIFEQHTLDCGRAEQRVFEVLNTYRRGKRGQEYFCVDLDQAKSEVRRICSLVDQELAAKTKIRPTDNPLSVQPRKNSRSLENSRSLNDQAIQENRISSEDNKPSIRVEVPKEKIPGGMAATPAKSNHRFFKVISLLGIVIFLFSVFYEKKSDAKRVVSYPSPLAGNSHFTGNVSPTTTDPTRTEKSDLPHLTDQGGERAARAALADVNKGLSSDGSQGALNESSSANFDAELARIKREAEASLNHARNKNTKPTELILPNRANSTFTERPQISPEENSSKKVVTSEDLTVEERRSLESACSTVRVTEGPASYNECRSRLLASFDPAKRPSGLDSLNEQERRSLESACSTVRVTEGPASYNECRSRLLAGFDPAKRPSGLDSLNEQERRSLESACSTVRVTKGPAAYNECRSRLLAEFDPNKRP